MFFSSFAFRRSRPSSLPVFFPFPSSSASFVSHNPSPNAYLNAPEEEEEKGGNASIAVPAEGNPAQSVQFGNEIGEKGVRRVGGIFFLPRSRTSSIHCMSALSSYPTAFFLFFNFFSSNPSSSVTAASSLRRRSCS